MRVTQPDFRSARERLVIGNWKMNPAALPEALALARAATSTERGAVTVGVAPPSPWIVPVADALRGSDVLLFAQDAHWEERGAFTAQTSAPMLVGIANGTIVGHSEVRRDQGDDDARVAAKAAAALRNGLRVVYCLGESLDERESGQTAAVITRQVRGGLGSIQRDLFTAPDGTWRLAIAYEPIWAIGTGRNATAEDAQAICGLIRQLVGEKHGADVAGETRVQYGGSVKPTNIEELIAQPDVDGALVGGASLDPDDFARIVLGARG